MSISILFFLSATVLADDTFDDLYWEVEEETPPATSAPEASVSEEQSLTEEQILYMEIEESIMDGTIGMDTVELIKTFIYRYPNSQATPYLKELLVNAQEVIMLEAPAESSEAEKFEASPDVQANTCAEGSVAAEKAVSEKVVPGPVLLGLVGGGVGSLVGTAGASIVSASFVPSAPPVMVVASDEYLQCYQNTYTSAMRRKRAGLAFRGGAFPIMIYGIVSIVEVSSY